ncbi:MAG TPA: type IX secretion system outer membrane channel protein PorV [Bacteroidales bacterium]|nr:type IX secretion system outer membrane channel protein PorV [Bacteroidales bacterium]
MNIKVLISAIFLLISYASIGQITTGQLTGEVNTITTAVPFLTIAVDSRAGAMGDAGVATLPDANSQHHNPAKYMFIDKDVGMSISYTPWLRKLINDINLGYLSGYKKFGKKQVVSASLRYFSLGNITFTDIVGNVTGQFNPNEFAIDLAYTRLYTRHLSGSVAMRYIYSNLTGGQYVQTTSTHPGNAIAADIAVYYYKPLEINKKDAIFTGGLNISNIGSKISYTSNDEKNFIPTTLKIGAGLSLDLDEYNTIAFSGQVEKLLVPTPPIYYEDSLDGDGNPVIEYGKDPNVSVPVGIFQSFYDAPGVAKDPLNPDDRSVLREEVREFNYSIGIEYWYAKQFAIRAGYFHEHPTKGNREFFTIGLGLQLNVFGLDFSYLIPTYQQNPLENTLRFTLLFNFAGLENENKPEGE